MTKGEQQLREAGLWDCGGGSASDPTARRSDGGGDARGRQRCEEARAARGAGGFSMGLGTETERFPGRAVLRVREKV